MNQWIYLLLFFFITLLSEILGTVGGFGSSLFFVSLAQFFFSFQVVLVLTGLLHVFSNSAKLYLFWRTIDWKLVLWLGVPSIVLSIGGAILIRHVEFTYSKILLGSFLILFSVLLFLRPGLTMAPTFVNSVWGGSLAGFLAGFIGTGGAIRGLVLAAFNLEKNLFVGTSAAIDFGVDLSRSVIYLESNYMDQTMWWYMPVLFVIAIIGSYLGKLILNRLSQATFKKIILGFIFLIGVLLIINEI